jgi:hypothetical protein
MGGKHGWELGNVIQMREAAISREKVRTITEDFQKPPEKRFRESAKDGDRVCQSF